MGTRTLSALAIFTPTEAAGPSLGALTTLHVRETLIVKLSRSETHNSYAFLSRGREINPLWHELILDLRFSGILIYFVSCMKK